MHIGSHALVHIYTWGPVCHSSRASIALFCCGLVLRQAPSLAWSSPARLGGQRAPGICLALALQCWDQQHTPRCSILFLTLVLGIEPSSLCLQGKYLVISLHLSRLIKKFNFFKRKNFALQKHTNTNLYIQMDGWTDDRHRKPLPISVLISAKSSHKKRKHHKPSNRG